MFSFLLNPSQISLLLLQYFPLPEVHVLEVTAVGVCHCLSRSVQSRFALCLFLEAGDARLPVLPWYSREHLPPTAALHNAIINLSKRFYRLAPDQQHQNHFVAQESLKTLFHNF